MEILTIKRQQELQAIIDCFTDEEIVFLSSKVESRLAASKYRKPFPETITINQFPAEILSLIFGYLHDAETIAICTLICKLWRGIFTDNHVWRQVCKKKSYSSYIPRFRLRSRSDVRDSSSTSSSVFGSAESLALKKQISLFPWRKIYMNNYMTWRNWILGKYQVTSVGKDDSLPIDFDDQKALSIKRGHPARLWDIATGKDALRLEHPEGNISTVKFNSAHIAIGLSNGVIRIWDIVLARWTVVLEGHDDEIGALCFGPNNMLISGSEDSTIRVWDLSTGLTKCLLRGHSDSVCSVFAYQDFLVSASNDSSIKVWSLQSGHCLRTLLGHEGAVFCVQMDARFVISGGHDATIRIWDYKSGKLERVLKGHHHAVVSLQFDQSKIVSGSADKTLKVWDIKTGACLYSLMRHASGIWNVKFNKSQIISSSFDNSLLIWDFSSSQDF